MTSQELQNHLSEREDGRKTIELMDKLGFSLDFVAANVLSKADVTIAQTAMLWMGMPNKHDRKRTRQLFDALAAVGLLKPADEEGETWRPITR
ncbi:MAG: hypothetical protein GIW99_11100 [Candidatus Eremiobacteraeota bacterium]|nr:hypothetical protein [Candidatus Eremiobacteraeota bacterium]